MTTRAGFLGIDLGTQGLTVIFTNERLEILAAAESSYDMVPERPAGCYEQRPEDWESAPGKAMSALRSQLDRIVTSWEVIAIGMSGQMHGEVLMDGHGQSLGPARLWCDQRNEETGLELTQRFQVKIPKRMTVARWLWTIRQQPRQASRVAFLTTPAGWLAHRLTGESLLGIGDASGMFPVDGNTSDYHCALLDSFAAATTGIDVAPLQSLLPQVRRAGEDGGTLHARGAALLGLRPGIPVAPAEGDQPAALAGSLIGEAGWLSMSFGTSVCANSVGDRAFQGVHPAVDHFCAVDGQPINMIWLRNGTTFMNAMVAMFSSDPDGTDAFARVMPQLLAAPPDCGGLLAYPFLDDEPGLAITCGGSAMICGFNPQNATCGNIAKAALLATMFNLRLGSEVLAEQGFPRKHVVLSGGLAKTPDIGQLVADVFRTSVTVLQSAAEGTAWGAALLAKYRHRRGAGATEDWCTFLQQQRPAEGTDRCFRPSSQDADAYDAVYDRYRQLLRAHPTLANAMRPHSPAVEVVPPVSRL